MQFNIWGFPLETRLFFTTPIHFVVVKAQKMAEPVAV